MMITAVLAAADAAGGFSWKTLLTFVGAAILLAFFSSIGIIARLRDRRIEDRKEAAERQRREAARPQPGTSTGQQDAAGPTS